jgi:ATP-dependent Clp protease ATP-binding subunit ClpA
MNFQEIKDYSKKYSSAILLNQRIIPSTRSAIINSSFVIFFFSSLFLVVVGLGSYGIIGNFSYKEFVLLLSPYKNIFLFTEVVSGLVFIFLYALHTYSQYFILNSVERVFNNNDTRFRVSYEAAQALTSNEGDSFVKGLLSVPESHFILNRLCISSEDVFNVTSDIVIVSGERVPEYNETVTLGSLWKLLYESSHEFKKALLFKKIQKETYDETCDWLDRILEEEKRHSAWWWRENLSKTRGVAKSLSYGSVYWIDKYARELGMDRNTEELEKVLLHKNSIHTLEEALSKKHGANAVVVGSRGSGRYTVIKILAKMIDQGNCYSEIEHKRVFEFDNSVLGSLDASSFIEVFGRCFEEALIARNIIFVINNIPELFDMTKRQGIDLLQVLERYITHPHISLVCVCDQSFYQNEAHKAVFDKDFEVVRVEEMNNKLLVPYIQDQAGIIENLTGTFFPSHSISIIAAALNKYFVEDSPLVKTFDLMYKIATNNSNAKDIILDEMSVSNTIKSMTGVSTGEIQDDEKEKLLNLEAILHKKVMGQDEAIKVVSSTMRRSRVGLVNANKPIGSFLFLGGTGVGKTETAKTLAEVFFGSEDHMSRIDMNEYTVGNSSYRLLGDENQEGDLAKCIHGRPYGVLLLDEFEKATTEVKDIFLRVLDEGVFTNGAGKIISARTQIIVATSNAGSHYIRESGLNPNSTKEEAEKIKTKIVDSIISDGLFRPELINRFDAVVLFHPLGEDSRILIAKKMLEALKQRALLQGYDVTFTDSLIQKVLGSDDDIVFGGRAIQRNIQTSVEEALAKKIIEGSLHAGGVIVLDSEDILL